IKNVSNIDNKEFENIKKNRNETKYDLIDLKYENNEIPYDSNKNVYYISKCDGKEDFDIFYNKNTIVKSVANISENRIKLIAYNKNKYKIYNICLTYFPIINIELYYNDGKKELISNNYTYGDISIFDNKTNKMELNFIKRKAKFKIRGLSSSYYDKKSYSIKFIDPKTGDDIIINNFLGFNGNKIFALNSLYEDNSKIRDMLSLESWKHINKKNNNNIDMNYVELFINDRYYGLYGLGEVINEYTLNIKQENDFIYKISDHRVPLISSFNDDYTKNGGIEIVYPKDVNKTNWEPLKNFIDIVYYSDDERFNKNILEYINIDNCVDYFILSELIYNIDGTWKNTVLSYDYNSNKLTKIPWDLDLTWGAHWDDNSKLWVNYNIKYSNNLLCQDKSSFLKIYLEKRLWENNVGNFRSKVAQKWKVLRKEFLETESLVNYANKLYDEVTESGAREREHERWPDGGYSTDNKFIEIFIRQRLEYLDGEFLKYLDDDTGGN
ncbi:MAG: CotH kinase family protein, partial [Intestinibacter sp.]|uniref:CotH kinase family protein n=1 Tax=Intestinibacter sp. TaxID=1965304 RepID=UPI002A825C5D